MKRLPSNVARDKLVRFARKHLGKPYKYGAKPSEAPKTFDCSSFTQYLYRRIGTDLPRTAIEQAGLGKIVNPNKEKLEVGDLLFCTGSWGRYSPEFPRGIGHVAIFVGDGKIIHAKFERNKDGSEGGSVREETTRSFLGRKDLVVIKRIL